MDPETLVATAFVAGALAGLSGTASQIVTDSYARLKHLLAHKLSARRDLLAVLEKASVKPEPHDLDSIRSAIAVGGVNEEILAKAREILSNTVHAKDRSGKFQVDLREAKGVQVGDMNIQNNMIQ